jgi:membrane fusion protein (multidrug efflux system)
MKRGVAFVIVLIGLTLLSVGLAYFQFIVKPQIIKQFISAAVPPPPTVAVVEAKAEIWEPRLPAIGSFRAIQGVDISPELGGIIKGLYVESGQDVKKGALLFEVDTSVEQADLKSNLATLKNASLIFERQSQLTLSGNTAKANVDSSEAARDAAAASVERVRAIIAQKTIAAPFAGRLGIRKVDLGQYVSPGTSLITLQKLDPIYVDFPVPEKSINLLRVGQQVDIKADAFPDKVFRGTVKIIDARVSLESRNVLIRGEVENRELRLLPGMFANVTVRAGEPMQTVVLPRTAITYSLYGDSVFVVVPIIQQDGQAAIGQAQAAVASSADLSGDAAVKVERRFIRTGEARDDLVAILEGVKPGEKVVTQGQLKLQPGMRVAIDPKSRLVPPLIRSKE